MILLDTDVLFAHLRGVEAARYWLLEASTREPLAISVVSVSELVGGMRSGERREVWALLAALHKVPVSEMIARRAGDLMRDFRRSHSGIGLADYLIAATAEIEGAQLATLNTRHFPMFPALEAPFRLP